MSHVPFVGCAGKTGGVSSDGLVKSKNSVMSSAAASRRVSDGTLKLASMNLRIEVSSRFLWETKCGFTHGETTTNGMRNPERLKRPGMSSGVNMGAMSSGVGTWNGAT